jgi:hypothetical protein
VLQDNADIPKDAVELVYNHWLSKRRANVRPLLQRLWCESPWARLSALGKGTADGSESGDEELAGPFTGTDSPARLSVRARSISLSEYTERWQAVRYG